LAFAAEREPAQILFQPVKANRIGMAKITSPISN
jgi:hypothetical protein